MKHVIRVQESSDRFFDLDLFLILWCIMLHLIVAWGLSTIATSLQKADVSSSCLGAERAGGSWLRGLVSSYMICTWHGRTFSSSFGQGWQLHFNCQLMFSFSSSFCFHLYCVFPTGRGPCLEQIPTSELSDFDGLRKERVHDLSGGLTESRWSRWFPSVVSPEAWSPFSVRALGRWRCL